MPPSTIHMDHVRSQIRHQQTASLERQTADIANDGSPTAKSGKDGDGEGMSFWDVLDVVNPLQHIPGVNKIYQAITGDTIKSPAKIAGAALFFGPIGIAVAAADAVVEKTTGKDTLDHVASTLGLEGDEPAAEDDPFTVTAQRPRRTADAAAPAEKGAQAAPVVEKTAAAPAAGQPVELSDGQAALLESLMGASGSTARTPAAIAQASPVVAKAAPAATAGSISAHAPATGGIATAQQLKALESTPGASAAVSAARGLGSSAVMASLPTPGAAGAGDNLLASMAQDQAKGARTGKGLAEYRAAAISSGSMAARPMIPSKSAQMVQNGAANMPGANYTSNPLLTTRTAGTTTGTTHQTPASAPAAAAEPAVAQPSAATASVQSPADPTAVTPTPVPKEQIAEMMARAMSKYEAQARRKTDTGTTTIH